MQVTVRFTQPDSLFNKEMSSIAGSVSQAAFMEARGKQYGTPSGGVMCTGPYEFGAWKTGQGITLEANEEYWDAELLPKVRRIEFEFLADASTMTNALLSGDVDGAYEVPISSIEALERASDGTLYFGPSLQVSELQLANQMSDKRLREALNLAIDKEALARTVYGQAGEANRALVPPSGWESSPAREIYREAYEALPGRPDVEKAKALVAEAGRLPRPMGIAVRVGDQTALRVATFIQESAKSVGMPMEIKALQPTTFGELFLPDNRKAGIDAILASSYLNVPDPLDYVPLFAFKDAWINYIGYDDPKVAKLVNEAQKTMDPSKQAELLVEAQALYEPLTIPLMSLREVLFLNDRVSGVPASFSYLFSPWAASLGGT